MGRKSKEEENKAVRITITVDKSIAEQINKFSEIECLPVSRLIARILKRYFEMK